MNRKEMMRQAINKLDVEVRMPQRAKERAHDIGSLPKRLDFKSMKLLNVLKNSSIASQILGDYMNGGVGELPTYVIERLEEEISHGAEEAKRYSCEGRFGAFVVSLMVWEGIFWVEANDFEKICYFTSLEDADRYASDIAKSSG